MSILGTILVEVVAGLIGIFVGTLAALAVERQKERLSNRRRARILLRSLAQELQANHTTLQAAKPAYEDTPFGKSFYLSTIAWETAMAAGDMPAIIGFELADLIAAQYALLVRIRYYVDLLTRLWLAPAGIDGYERIREGFSRAIVEAMHQALRNGPRVAGEIGKALKA